MHILRTYCEHITHKLQHFTEYLFMHILQHLTGCLWALMRQKEPLRAVQQACTAEHDDQHKVYLVWSAAWCYCTHSASGTVPAKGKAAFLSLKQPAEACVRNQLARLSSVPPAKVSAGPPYRHALHGHLYAAGDCVKLGGHVAYLCPGINAPCRCCL